MGLEFHSVLDNDVVGVGRLARFKGGVSGFEVGACAVFSEPFVNGFVFESGLFGLFLRGDHLPHEWIYDFAVEAEQGMFFLHRSCFALDVGELVVDLGCFGFNCFLALAKRIEFLLALITGACPFGDGVVAGLWVKQLLQPAAVVAGALCVLDFPRGLVDFALGIAFLIGKCQALLVEFSALSFQLIAEVF